MENLVQFALHISKASYDKATNTRRWAAVASDTGDDVFYDSMTIKLFRDFIARMDSKELPPPEFCSNFWSGGKPYVSVSHYPDVDGKAVPGMVESVYIDGDKLKAKGIFYDTPLGRAAFESICDDLYGVQKSQTNPVRISIAFLDYEHEHKSTGYHFVRKSIEEICPQCLKESSQKNSGGKIYLAGHLIHLAMTRVPANGRTSMEVDKSMTTRLEDAESIVGKELAEGIEKSAAEVNKALVIKGTAEVGSENSDDTDYEEEEKEEKEMNKKGKMSDEDKAEMKSLFVELAKAAFAEISVEKSAVKPSHPLDNALELFKNAYDGVAGSPDGLAKLQPHFEDLAASIQKSLAPSTPSEPVQDTATPDLVKALSEAMQPIAQKLDLLNAQLTQRSAATAENVTTVPQLNPVAPPRRSISPEVVKSVTNQPVQKSATPNLRAIIERTTF